jgi:hypothetical protein
VSPRRPIEIHTVSFHPPPPGSPWLVSARHYDQRMKLLDRASEAVEDGILVLPAGFLHTSSIEAADEAAHALVDRAENVGLSFVFGVDVGGDPADWAPLATQPDAWAFVCAPARSPWRVRQVRGRTGNATETRVIELDSARIAVLLGSEVFNATIRRELVRRRPDAIVVLTHRGPTDRWRTALGGLSAVAPTIIVGESPSGEEPQWAVAPAGWIAEPVSRAEELIVRRYRRQEVEARERAAAE